MSDEFLKPKDVETLRGKNPKLTEQQFAEFLFAVERHRLDPFSNQIYAVSRWDKRAKLHNMTVQTGIDGYRLVADRTGSYAGNDDPVYDDENKPRRATVSVYKIVSGQRCAFTATSRWDQYYPGEKQGAMWHKMPHLMLGKCAEALALRKAFPSELSGLYTKEEMQQTDQTGDVAEPPPGTTTADKLPPPAKKTQPPAKKTPPPAKKTQPPANATPTAVEFMRDVLDKMRKGEIPKWARDRDLITYEQIMADLVRRSKTWPSKLDPATQAECKNVLEEIEAVCAACQ